MTSPTQKIGALLLNLGTPDDPSTPSVRRYLDEFLMDPYVIDIPAVLRWFLVKCVILPRRPQKSAAQYRKIWSERGSPLRFYLEEVASKVQETLGREWVVAHGMRYGNPSLRGAFLQLQAAGVKRVVVFPFYPQYSLAATESSLDACRQVIAQTAPGMRLSFIDPFYDHPLFIDAFEDQMRSSLEGFQWDHVLFSYHGLPERQIRKVDSSGSTCLARPDCCDQMRNENQNCYRAQCYRTSRLLAERLGLNQEQFSVSFQSRLGRTPWIRPYTDELYERFPAQGIKNLAVVSPSFVADCLETLEEVQIRGSEQFQKSGGKELRLVPSLNSQPKWIHAVSEILRETSVN